jgi:hypothetical protein
MVNTLHFILTRMFLMLTARSGFMHAGRMDITGIIQYKRLEKGYSRMLQQVVPVSVTRKIKSLRCFAG